MIDTTKLRMIVCDLDGTLAISKENIDIEMALLIDETLLRYSFAVISGASLPLLKDKFYSHLSEQMYSKKLYVLPTSGASMYEIVQGEAVLSYEEKLTFAERDKIINALNLSLREIAFDIPQYWGDIIEFRGTSVTYSALGQLAPQFAKESWDPDHIKRLALRSLLTDRLPEFSISLGGMTSLDITKIGIDKSYGIRNLSEYSGVAIDEMIYFGDALFQNGNDYVVKMTEIECIEVTSPNETKKMFKDILSKS